MNVAKRKRILVLRRQGLSLAQVAAKFGCTRQAVHQMERTALKAQGVTGSLDATEFARERAHNGAYYRDRGRMVNISELRWDDETPSRGCFARNHQRLEDSVGAAIDRLLTSKRVDWRGVLDQYLKLDSAR